METMPEHTLPAPPDWSLALGDAGRFLVVAAAVLFVVSILGWLFGKSNKTLAKVGAWSFTGGSIALFAVITILGILFANNRFEYEYVWGHSDTTNTLPYQLAGIWAGQEGSFLLWGVCAALFGVWAARGAGDYRRWFTIAYAVPLAAISAVLAYETPFGLNRAFGRVVVPEDGVGLVPALQNYWVTIHPPVIFLGFGALTVMFAYSIAAMIQGDHHTWARLVRPWNILALTLVGLGLCMGGFWAYETLGWGGFWMWDPVENVSFVPWALTAALIHGLIVQINHRKWVASNLLLAALPFLTYVYGTFLTRSGFLAETSVHSFAEMDRAALRVLVGLLAVTTGGFLILWIRHLVTAPKAAEETSTDSGIGLEFFYKTGSFLLACFALATLLGMSMPFFMAVSGRAAKVVEEQLYHQVLSFFFVPLMLVMACTPFLAWRKMPFRDFWKRIYNAFCISFALTGLTLLAMVAPQVRSMITLGGNLEAIGGIEFPGLPWLLVLMGLCWFVLVSNFWRLVEVAKRNRMGTAAFLSHIGVAVLMAGLIFSRGFETKETTTVQEGRPGKAMGYTIAYQKQTSDRYDRKNKVLFQMESKGNKFVARPGLYYVRSEDGMENPMIWPHIERYPLHDVYVTLQPEQSDATGVVTVKPGESFDLGRFQFKFVKLDRKGDMDSFGTEFIARVEASTSVGKFEIAPSMKMTEDGIQSVDAPIGHALTMKMLGMDPAEGSVNLQVRFNTPIFPVEVYYKPLTILVWVGTAILTIAGLMAAFYRRRSEGAAA